MRFHVLTLFPEPFGQPPSRSGAEAFSEGPPPEVGTGAAGSLVFSIVARAVQRGQVSIEVTDIRDHTHDAHGTADDYQFGGGHGMVMKPEPVFEAAEAALSGYSAEEREEIPVILTTPQGELLTQRLVEELSEAPAIAIICGHYAGVDDRIAEGLATREVSTGDYVLTGGELPAMIIIDAVTRLLPGVVGSPGSVAADSITTGLLQHPLYTRPAEYRGMPVPDVLLSGHHAEIDKWRRRKALERTLARRPDLLPSAPLTEEDRRYLAELGYEETPSP